MEFENQIANTKKANLDEFVKKFKKWRKAKDKRANATAVTRLMRNVGETLSEMESVFVMKDSLLRQVGMVTVYYHLYRMVKLEMATNVKRRMLARFEKDRLQNREIVEWAGEGAATVDTDLLEFDKHSQTPNDAYAIRIRLKILLRYLAKNFRVKYKKSALEPAD